MDCERCGKIVAEVWYPAVYVVKKGEQGTRDERVTLCLECRRKLRKWLDGLGDFRAVGSSDDLHRSNRV